MVGFSALLTDEGASEVGAPPSFFANNPPKASKGFHLSSVLYVAVNSLSEEMGDIGDLFGMLFGQGMGGMNMGGMNMGTMHMGGMPGGRMNMGPEIRVFHGPGFPGQGFPFLRNPNRSLNMCIYLSCFSEKIWGAEVMVGLPPSLKSYIRRGAESGWAVSFMMLC